MYISLVQLTEILSASVPLMLGLKTCATMPDWLTYLFFLRVWVWEDFGAGEITELVKCLPHKYEDLNVDPQDTC